MRGLKALIFDVDGTLAETEEVHRAAFNEAFKAFDLPWVWDQGLYRELLLVSGGRERLQHYIETYDPPRGREMLGRIGDLHKFKTQRFARLIDDRRARFRPGVERLLDEARARGLKLALAATTSVPNAEALLLANMDTRGLDMFSAIVGGDEITNRKPAPDIYLLALERLGLPARNCVVFEDSVNGLKSALAAGLRVVVTPSVYTARQDFTGAFSVLSHLGDPFDPYEHLAGAGEQDRMVSVNALRRWIDDDDDMRSLLTIGGRSLF
ncbi:HAD-IA family hydrolase [Chthonobacter albigriseus]|uniref:HAD-IA family hydrolase n=1 Tax=Chthonobacter albigriseus TaxID=1683161 RepID=UPI0015EF7F7C|nr:HAD-IA family hydrolase [Chthonobacter albigriseus]